MRIFNTGRVNDQGNLDLAVFNTLNAAVLDRLLDLHQPATGLRHIDIDRIKLRDRGQRIRLVGRHKCTFGHIRCTDLARNRGGYGGVFDIDTCLVDLCACCGNCCFRLRFCGNRVVKGLLGNRLGFHKAFVTLAGFGRLIKGRTLPGKFRLCRVKFRHVNGLINHIKLLTGFNKRAFGKVAFLDDTIDLRAHGSLAEGNGTTRHFLDQTDGLRFKRHGTNRRCLRLLLCAGIRLLRFFLLVTGRNHQCKHSNACKFQTRSHRQNDFPSHSPVSSAALSGEYQAALPLNY